MGQHVGFFGWGGASSSGVPGQAGGLGRFQAVAGWAGLRVQAEICGLGWGVGGLWAGLWAGLGLAELELWGASCARAGP